MSKVLSVRGLAGLVVVPAILLVATGAAAAPAAKPVPGEKAALRAVSEALKSGRLDPATAAADRREIARAAHLVRSLPNGRGVHVDVALEEVGAFVGRLTKPRAIALFGQLRANDDYFASHWAPRSGFDITDSDGIVYRYFAGRCFEFHPLANFGALNGRVSARDAPGTQRLADALTARGVSRQGGGIGWEYYFPFGAGTPWSSGMAQAVAAQAFARAAALVPDESAALLREAGAAYRAIPGRLLTKVAAGPWIRLYSFKSTAVLNAQLQSILSLEVYAQAAGDEGAAALAARMQAAAAATLSRFDTGYWTYYSLAGVPSPLSYQQFVVQLLRKLAPADPRFASAADRFALYLRQPPAFKVATAAPGALRFWLSKPSSVSVATAAGSTAHLSLGAGWHTLRWREPEHPGIYGIKVTAVGPAGNRASFQALPIVRVTAADHRSAQTRGTAAAASAPATLPAFAVGAGIDGPSQAKSAASLGLQLVRQTILWQSGDTAPDAGVVASLQSPPSGPGLVLELSADQLPADDSGRTELGRYTASLAGQVPSLRDVVLLPAPTLATAGAYADALAAIRMAVRSVRSDVAVGPSFDGSTPQPQRTAAALAKRLAHDGAGVDLVAFRPAPATGAGKWTAGEVGRLGSALETSLATTPPVLIDAVATPTTVPASELPAYAGGPPPTEGTVSPRTQASAYTDAIDAASCSANVVGLLLDRLVDDATTPLPATGIYYASGHPKPSVVAVKQAIRTITRGAVVCPGTAAVVKPTTLTFPSSLGGTSQTSMNLACNRDCLYLVTLDRADGRPVVAARGSLDGGAPPKMITLPSRKLPPGRYRVDLRLVSAVNPGSLTRRTSPPLASG